MNIITNNPRKSKLIIRIGHRYFKKRHKVFLIIVVVGISCLFLFFSSDEYHKTYPPKTFIYLRTKSKSTFSSKACQNVTTLLQYSSNILQCQKKNMFRISTDISILSESVTSSRWNQNITLTKQSYFSSKEFLKFKAFHHLTQFPLSVHSLDDSLFVIRLPVLDTLKYPNNNPAYLYAYRQPILHWSQHNQPNIRPFANRSYIIGAAKQYEAAFFIVTDAFATSADGNILVQTCSRAITAVGCSSSNTSARLQSKFPIDKKNRMCSKNSTGIHANIISVNKLVIIAHTWYNAYYHLTIEAMSRLMILHELLIFDSEIYILLQYPLYKKAAKQLFELYRIAENRIIYFSSKVEGSTFFRAQTMFIPRGIDCGGAPPSLLEQLIVKGLNPSKSGVTPPKPYTLIPTPVVHIANQTTRNLSSNMFGVKTGPIVVVSRSNRGRNIENEADILNFLANEYSTIPVIIFYGNMSLTETISLFHSARVLITPHGAGQSHILWMRPGTAMLEISPQYRYNSLYQTIAIYRQIYTAVLFDVMATRKSKIKVNISMFKQLFKQLMKGRY